jgi:1-acyl-sn-glycerol-3-phosphate acyltransferase
MRRILGFMRVLVASAFTIVVAVIAILSILISVKTGHAYHNVGRFWARGVLALCGLRLTVTGKDLLDPRENYVYVSNHASLFDIPVVMAGIPDQIRLVYKKELEKIPVFGWCLKWGPYIGIDRSNRIEAKRSVEEAARKIKNGASVLLYAEGTRSPDGKLQPFKRGAFNLAVQSGVPVVPLTINGTFRILPKHSISVRPGNVEIVFAPPIPVTMNGGKEEELRIMDLVHHSLSATYRNQE